MFDDSKMAGDAAFNNLSVNTTNATKITVSEHVVTGTANVNNLNVSGTVTLNTSDFSVENLTVTGTIQRSVTPLSVEMVETYATCLKLRWTLPEEMKDVEAYRLYIWEDGVAKTGLGVGARDYLLIDRTTIGPAILNQTPPVTLNTSFLDDLDLIGHVFNIDMYSGSVNSKSVTSRIAHGETVASQVFEIYVYLYKYDLTIDSCLSPYALLPETPYQFQVVAVSTGGDELIGPRSGDITTAALQDWERVDILSYGNLPLRSHSTPFDSVAHAITEDESENANMIKLSNDDVADWKISYKNSVYSFDSNGAEAAVDYDDSTWDDIALPACFNYPRYGDKQYGKPMYLCHQHLFLPLNAHVAGTRGLVVESDDASIVYPYAGKDLGHGVTGEVVSRPKKLKFVDSRAQPERATGNQDDQPAATCTSISGRANMFLFRDRGYLGLVPFAQYNPCGMLRKTFTVPSGWSGKRIIVSLEAIKSNFYLYINGVKIGYGACSSKSMNEFDVTSHVTVGENVITLKIIQFDTSAVTFEDHDAWRVIGPTRDIYVYAVDNRVAINDCYIEIPSSNVVLGADNMAASANIFPQISFLANGTQSANVAFYLNEWGTTSEGSLTLIGSQTVTPTANANTVVTFNTMTVTDKKLWSAETPDLYQFVVKVTTPAGALMDTRMFQIGFKKVEWSIFDPANPSAHFGGLKLNGKIIKMKGVNKHELDPNSQNYAPKETFYNDVQTMKNFNFNTFRTSHYPNSKHSYRSANELGVYVITEVDAGNNGWSILGGQGGGGAQGANAGIIGNSANYTGTVSSGVDYDPIFIPEFVERIRRCVIEHRNDPSIMMVSTFNESGMGDTHVAGYQYIRNNHLCDSIPTLLTIYNSAPAFYEDNSPFNGGFNSNYSRIFPLKYPIPGDTNTSNLVPNEKRACDFTGMAYPRPAPQMDGSYFDRQMSMVAYQQVLAKYRLSFVAQEYGHNMGNSGGYLDKYWNGPKEYFDQPAQPEYSIRGNEYFIGGCTWDFKDQSLWADSFNVPGLKWIRGYGGDWNEPLTSGGFCQNGTFNCNASPTPGAYDFLNVQCPFRATLGYLNDGASGFLGHANVTIFNENQFVNANTLVDVKWSLLKNGVELDTGFLSNNISANTASSLEVVDLTSVVDNGTDEFHFKVSFPDVNGALDPYRDANGFLKPYTYFNAGVQYLNSNIADYLAYNPTSNIVLERGFEEIPLFESRSYEKMNPLSTVSAYTVQNKGGFYVITSTGINPTDPGYFKMELNKKNGVVESLTTGGTIIRKMAPNFYNRMNANAFGIAIYSNDIQNNEDLWVEAFEKYQPVQPTIDIVNTAEKCEITIDTSLEIDAGQSPLVTIGAVFTAIDPTTFGYDPTIQKVNKPVFKKAWTFPISLKYTLVPNRTVEVDFTVSRDDTGNRRDHYFGTIDLSPRFPCVGMSFLKATPTKALATPMTVFGKGPIDTMKDRSVGQQTGVYSGTVKNFQYDYTLSEPSGIHVNTRYAEVSDLVISSNLVTSDSTPMPAGMILSVNDYLPSQQNDYRHGEDIPRLNPYGVGYGTSVPFYPARSVPGLFLVNVLADHLGAGGYSSWSGDSISYGVSDVQGAEYNLKFNLFDKSADQVPSLV
jgi:beta-galactosidase/beta-glucuronidase